MVQIRANNEEMVSALNSVKERAELLDQAGNLLGYFMPVDSDPDIIRRKIYADYASGEYQMRKARTEREEKFTTEQVLERLRALESS